MDVPTEAVICTDELRLRPSRAPDFEGESRALGKLMQALAEAPERILQTLVETMVDSFRVGSAGCSVLVEKGAIPRFHWPAIAGAWRDHVGGEMPRDFGPCGDVLDRNAPLLFRQPQRRYTYLQEVTPGIEECLLAPFHVDGVPIGTIWLVAHDESRRFDAEDLRQLLTLSRFASSAYKIRGFSERMRGMNEALLLGVLRQHESAEAEEKLNAKLRAEIAERKAIEAELKLATQKARQASLSKSDFLANMSHELRTPLGAMLGHAQLIELGSVLTERQRRSVTQIQKAGWHLAEIINDVLDLAQVEAGKLSVRLETVALSDVLRECETMMEPLASARSITMDFPCREEAVFVSGDRKRIKQVLINLLSNAIKYNRQGGTVRIECPAPAADRVRISVSDTGKGLSAAQLAQLFQLFNRLGQDALDVGGTGLGLVMTKRLAELMGGSVGAESKVGQGSVFWIELKRVEPTVSIAPAVRPPYSVPASTATVEKTLLYVEDNASNLTMVQELMVHRRDIRLLSAHDGKEGIEMARMQHPDAILLDIQLPDINGIRVAEILAKDSETARIPVIACSANAMPQDISAAMEAGFFHYLTKPVNIGELMDTVDKAFGAARR